MKWLVAEFLHETNTFSNILPGRKQFEARELIHGEAIVREFRGTKACLGGFVDFLDQQKIEAMWTIAAFTMPAGRIQKDFYRWVKSELVKGLTEEVDGVLLSLHGAMCAEDVDDADADVLREVRRLVGPKVPIAAVLDFHGNMGQGVVTAADVLVGYKTYPHIDLYESAYQAAALLKRTVEGKIRPKMWLAHPPLMCAPGNTNTSQEPLKSVMARAAEMERMPGVLSVSVFAGFPFADVADAGMSALVMTDGEKADGAGLARGVVGDVVGAAEAFCHKAPGIAEAVGHAMAATRWPVVMADIADNPGGGGTGDGVEVLRELLEKKAAGAVVGPIWDPTAVEACREAGMKGKVTLDLGAHTDLLHGRSVMLTGEVIYLGDGKFVHRGPMSTGVTATMGNCAVVKNGGVEVLISSERLQNLDPEIFRSAGIEPTQKKIVVVKSSLHFRAAYGPMAAEIIEVEAPGLMCPNLKRYAYEKVRRPIYPLDAL